MGDLIARQRAPTAIGPTIIVVVFVVSRLAAWGAGLGFDTDLLGRGFQLLDVELLERSPVSSILYLHSQPPLFNVFAAVALRLPDGWFAGVVGVTYRLAGLGAALVLFATMRRLAVRQWIALVLVLLFVLSPEAMLYESLFYSSELQLLGLAVTLWLLARFAESRATLDGVLLASALGALVLLRSAYLPVLMVAILALVALVMRLGLRRSLVLFGIPVVVVAAWSVKNVVVFSTPSNSSWLGMNVWRVAQAGIAEDELRAWWEDGTLSEVSQQRAFSPPGAYEGLVARREFGRPATDRLTKANGEPNFNAGLYLAVSDRYLEDALAAFRAAGPASFLRSQAATYTVWFEPGDDYVLLPEERAEIEGYADAYDRWVLGRIAPVEFADPYRFSPSRSDVGTWEFWSDAISATSLTIVALHGLAVAGGIVAIRRKGPAAVVGWVGLALLAYSVVVGNAVEFGENNRFRYETMPVVLVLAALGADAGIGAGVRLLRSGGRTDVPMTPQTD